MRYPRSEDRNKHNTCAVYQNSLTALAKCQMRTPEKARKPNRIRWRADRFCIVYSDAPWARESTCSLLIGWPPSAPVILCACGQHMCRRKGAAALSAWWVLHRVLHSRPDVRGPSGLRRPGRRRSVLDGSLPPHGTVRRLKLERGWIWSAQARSTSIGIV